MDTLFVSLECAIGPHFWSGQMSRNCVHFKFQKNDGFDAHQGVIQGEALLAEHKKNGRMKRPSGMKKTSG